MNNNLLYGEVLPVGVDKAMNESHLDANRCVNFLELGSGLGKLAMQVYLQFPTIKSVVGVELSSGRSRRSFQSLLALRKLFPCRFVTPLASPSTTVELEEFPPTANHYDEKSEFKRIASSRIVTPKGRRIQFRQQDFLSIDTDEIHSADIIVLGTKAELDFFMF